MKNFFLTVAAIFAFGFANAQEATVNGFSKGDKFVEGSFSYTSQDKDLTPSVASSTWSFTPSMGYMLTDKWAIGGKLSFAGKEYNNDNKSTDLGITAFGRYYFLSLGASKSFQAYGELGLGYTSTTNDPKVGDKTTDGSLNANVDLGMNYFFTPHWAVTFELANIVSYKSTSPEVGDNSNDLEVKVNLFNNVFNQPYFGLLYKW